MDLWIRSQDQEELVEVHDIYIDDTGIFDEYTKEQIEKYKIYANGSNYLLAEYGDKERALEILDEIQNLMLKSAFAKKENGLGEVLDYIPNNLIIYKMPKE